MRSDPSRSEPSQPSSDRRTFLGSVASLGTGGAIERGSAIQLRDDHDADLSVMTRNLYLGVDLSRLFRGRSAADVRRIAGRMLADVERRPFPPRARAIAAEVAATRPDVVGVQEAALVRTRESSDFEVDPGPNAEGGVVDFLDVLRDALADRGLDYEVATSVVTSDVEVPADVDGREVDARLTDRDALLVRNGIDVGEIRTGTFEASLEVPVDDEVVSIDRGYCVADVSVDGAEATVATTHLEPADSTVRLRQARELLDVLPSDGSVVLAGDVNSGPGGSEGAYRRLTESFDDAHATLRPDAVGSTCCQDADLRNDRSRLSRRVDVVLSRGLRALAVERVGEDPGDRVPAAVDGQPTRLWPSDHAGVVASFGTGRSKRTAGASTRTTAETTTTARTRPGSRPTTTPSRTRTSPSSPEERTTSPPLSGFGLVASLSAVVLAAISRRLRGGS